MLIPQLSPSGKILLPLLLIFLKLGKIQTRTWFSSPVISRIMGQILKSFSNFWQWLDVFSQEKFSKDFNVGMKQAEQEFANWIVDGFITFITKLSYFFASFSVNNLKPAIPLPLVKRLRLSTPSLIKR
ncbi:hypothetical protein V4B17_02290 [Bartonella sp. B23]